MLVEGPLGKLGNRKPSERYAFLFDSMLLLCKSISTAPSASMTVTAAAISTLHSLGPATAPLGEEKAASLNACYKLKEKFLFLTVDRSPNKLLLVDRDDTEGVH